MSAELLAARAVRQYRRRDIIPYIGLRLYLDNKCSVRNIWAHEVCLDNVLKRKNQPYYATHHYKETSDDGKIIHREIHLPGPCESLAESALLAEFSCNNNFCLPDCVYSYMLSTSDVDRKGVFKPYFEGYKLRHDHIAKACSLNSDGLVLYTDIKKYYPSILHQSASNIFVDKSKKAGIKTTYIRAGEKILADHAATPTITPGGGILTGPMFSHFIGNLVLADLDKKMESLLPSGYFRYVDDIVLVGSPNKVLEVEKILEDSLKAMGFDPNPDKRLIVPTSRWLNSAGLFEEKSAPSWKSFVGSMKQYLLLNPKGRENLSKHLMEAGIRIRPIDYSVILMERDYLQRFSELFKFAWFKAKVRRLGPKSLIREAIQLRDRYHHAFQINLSELQKADLFERKQLVHRLRFLASRLVYLAPPDKLKSLADLLFPIKEMRVYAEVFLALSSLDVSRIVLFGSNAAQAVAQPLRAMNSPVVCLPKEWSEVVKQSVAVLKLNDINILKIENCEIEGHNLCEFAMTPGSDSLFCCGDQCIREIACLHGSGDPELMSRLIESAFDIDDDLIFDMQGLLSQSDSGCC